MGDSTGDISLPTRRRWRAFRWLLAPVGLGVAVLLSGCDSGVEFRAPTDAGATHLVVSEVWSNSNQDLAQARIDALTQAIDDLRRETGTGWIGRQDDVTGWLGDISGGSRDGTVTDFMDAYGSELFGVDTSVLSFEDADTQTIPGMVSTRAQQTVGEVPVRDAELVFTSRAGSAPAAEQVTGVHGRVFPELQVGTEPQIGPRAAARIAAKASGGTTQGRPSLVIVPTGKGILTWMVTTATTAGDSFGVAQYFVDALTGDVVDVRTASADAAPASRQGPPRSLDPDPNTVAVNGEDALARPLTGHGVRVPDGVELTDTTTPAWDQSTRQGGIRIYDATGIESFGGLPGRLMVNPDTQVRDPEAMAALAYGRAVLDYYSGLGRNSWDGKGGTLHAAVNYGPPDECNAYFSWSGPMPIMVYGNPCVVDGQVDSGSVVEPDITGHEVTHGVTAFSAGLLYTGQSGALNESFSDYFGNVIGDRIHGTDSVAFGEDSCVGIEGPTDGCLPNPDGTLSGRYMLNGYGLSDYLHMLDPGPRLKIRDIAYQDNGGVHFNSAIWNNALWSIRTQLAKINNTSPRESALAQSFDRAVYGALTTRLQPTSGFLDAAAAVQQVIIDSNLDPVVLRVAREVFDANEFCAGCAATGAATGNEVSSQQVTELHPVVSGDRVAWIALTGAEYAGDVMLAQADGSGVSRVGPSEAYEIGFAGEALMVLDVRGRVSRIDPSGESQVVAQVMADNTLARGFAGSDAGAAWAVGANAVTFAHPTGTVTTATVPGLSGDSVSAVGTGGGFVGVGSIGGKVYGWEPGQEPRQLGTMEGVVVDVAAYDGNVMASGCTTTARGRDPYVCTVKLFMGDGRTFSLSSNAIVLGAALSAEYAVWPEGQGRFTEGVIGNDPYAVQNSDLYLLSLATGKVYNLTAGNGQQGFPSLSGRRLVWQDAALGGDDIRTMVLPEGL